jgi:acyl carrier protein
MWARIIGIERVGLHDNFFEIGGDSLAAVELLAGVEQVTGRRLMIAALFEAPTVKQLAALLEQEDLGWPPCVIPSFASARGPVIVALLGAWAMINPRIKRRAAIEPVIGHLKEHHRMGAITSPMQAAMPSTPCSPPLATTSVGSSRG